jgi:NADH-quinone oxidoreductase subunit M
VIVALGAALAHAAAYSRTFFGEVPDRWRQSRHLEPHGGRFPDLGSGELGALALAAALMVAIGVAPGLLLRVTDSSGLDAAERVSPPGPTEVSSAPTREDADRLLALNSDRD